MLYEPMSDKEGFWMGVVFVAFGCCLALLMNSYIQDTHSEKTAVEAEN